MTSAPKECFLFFTLRYTLVFNAFQLKGFSPKNFVK